MARHSTKPGHKHTHVYGPLRKVQRMTARHHILSTIKKLTADDACTVDEACDMLGINILTYMRCCGDV